MLDTRTQRQSAATDLKAFIANKPELPFFGQTCDGAVTCSQENNGGVVRGSTIKGKSISAGK